MIWARGVKNIKHAGIDIFGDYWEEFNTMRVPILGEDRFFEIALELEHIATDEEDLKRLLLERRKLWEEEATKWLAVISRKCCLSDEDFLCEDACNTAYRASKTGSLQHFLELMNGVVYGWAADEVEDEVEDASRSTSAGSDIGMNKYPDFRTYYSDLLDSKNPIYHPQFDGNFHKAPVFTSDTSSLVRQRLSNENTDQEKKSPETSKDGSAGSIKDLSRPSKRPRIDDEIDGQAHKRQKKELVPYTNTSFHLNSDNISSATSSTNTHSTDATQGTSTTAARDISQKNRSKASREATTPRLSSVGLCADDEGGERGRKRQRESSEPPSPNRKRQRISSEPPSPKSSDIGNTSTRKKRPHKSNVKDKEKKRRGTQPVSTQASSPASFEPHQPCSSGKVTKRYKNERGSRCTPPLPLSTQSSRSTRRSRSLLLWELDSSGNPCLLPKSYSRA